jgi:hypothetical protein
MEASLQATLHEASEYLAKIISDSDKLFTPVLGIIHGSNGDKTEAIEVGK